MRQFLNGTARSKVQSEMPALTTPKRVRTQDHPLIGRPAPTIVIKDDTGKTWDLRAEISNGPLVIVFYLGSTCMACMTHLVELDVAGPHFRSRSARVLAISGDTPDFSLDRSGKFGGFQIPLLSDVNHDVSFNYGVWNNVVDGGEMRHGTFIIDGAGLVRWAYVGDRPFTDITALFIELDQLTVESSPLGR
jgi:peroxiredoxin